MQWVFTGCKRSGMSWHYMRCLLRKSTVPNKHVKFVKHNRLAQTFSSKPQRCHYEVLGLKKNATTKEIRESFVSLSKQLHPDRNRGQRDSHQSMVELNVAYTILIKPETRYAYDRTLNATAGPTSAHPTSAQEVYRQSYTNFYNKAYKEKVKEHQRMEEEWRKAEEEFRVEASKFLFRCVLLLPLLLVLPVLLVIFKGLVFGGNSRHGRHGPHHRCDTCIIIDQEIAALKEEEARKREKRV